MRASSAQLLLAGNSGSASDRPSFFSFLAIVDQATHDATWGEWDHHSVRGVVFKNECPAFVREA